MTKDAEERVGEIEDPPVGPRVIDGRTARRDRNRDLVLGAVIELFSEHQLAPSVSEVARRSGVSLRSVYRYFDDFDALVRAAIDQHQTTIAPLREIPDLGVGPLDERVARFVACRLRLYEAAAPAVRAALLRAPTNPIMLEQITRVREQLAYQTAAMFEPELALLAPNSRRAALAATDTLTQFEGVESLRVRLGYSIAQATDILCQSIAALFRPLPGPRPATGG